MDAFILPLLLLIAVFILAGLAKSLKGSSSNGKVVDSSQLGYRKKGPSFTPAERSFYGALLQAIGNDRCQGSLISLGRSPVADLLKPQPSRNQWIRAFNSISAKHFDFVIGKNDDLSPVFAIELDDKTYTQKHRQKRVGLLKNICRQTELILLQVLAQWAYKTEELKMMLAKDIEGGWTDELVCD